MADMEIEWFEVSDYGMKKKIGAIGLVDDKAVVAAAFFDDADWNNDGRVGVSERIFSRVPLAGTLFFRKGRQITEVLQRGLQEPEIVARDQSFREWAAVAYAEFGSSLVLDGVYLVYFRRSIKLGAKGLAKLATDNVVKQYVLRKGTERLVKRAYEAAVKSDAAFR